MNITSEQLVFVYALPAVPLACGWWRFSEASKRGETGNPVAAIACSVSLVWLLLGCAFPVILGSYYSHFRFVVIDGNFVAMMVAALVALSVRPKRQILIGISCISLAMIWAFIAALNAVV